MNAVSLPRESASAASTPAEPAGTVFIVDDDDSVRASLERLLTSEGLAVQQFAGAREFLEELPSAVPPCCVILDLGLPGLDGLSVQQRLREMEWAPAVLFLTGRGDVPSSVRAIKAGALDFFTKPFSPVELLAGVRNALSHERQLMLERRDLEKLRSRYASLTPRERQVMAGVVEGLLNKQIAARLGKSEVTVKEQRARALRKMAAESAADLVRMGTKLGIFTLDAELGRNPADEA